jgi:O-acetyl-ADP-ribose deacetylase (regulator of RNase III)
MILKSEEDLCNFGLMSLDIISITKGDITRQTVDAIVNAANSSLLGGGGVDGAIHRAAGPGLLEECRKLNGCPTGQARITGGYNLPARYVIHTVGPVWQGGHHDENTTLAHCYRSCLELAERYYIKTIAFPSISTGTYRFPIEKASKIAIMQIGKCLKRIKSIQQVIIVCFNEGVYKCYLDAMENI